jgi:hypothetical protein
MKLSLRTAAAQAGVSKTTIIRAIRSGRLSAPRNDDGGYAIDPAELFRVYPPGAGVEEDQEDRNGTAPGDRDAPPAGPPDASERTRGTTLDLEVRLARAEARLEVLEGVLELERRRAEERAEELRQERDRWAGMAEASQRQLVDLTKRPRGLARWFRWGA